DLRIWRDYSISIAILLIASTMTPFALVAAGVVPPRLFYIAFMPILGLLLFRAKTIRVNPYIGLIIGGQIAVLLIVFLIEWSTGHFLTALTLLSVFLVSVVMSSGLLDVRRFVRVLVLATIGVLVLAAVSWILAYRGLAIPVPRFDRGEGAMVY